MKIKKIDMELTTACNGKCKFCCRHKYGTDFNEIDFKVLKTSLEPLLNDLEHVMICGSFGDAIFYDHLLDLVDFLDNKVDILIVTNSSVGDEHFWKTLASYNSVKIIFPLDGLEGTYELYRGIKVDSVLKNINIYLKNGGNAQAQMLLFKHNQHQTEEAKKIIEDMGGSIYYRVSRQYDDELERPTKFPVKTLGEMSEGNKVVHCDFMEQKFIYLTAKGEIVPCCNYNPGRFSDLFGIDEELDKVYKLSRNDINIYKSDIKKALNSPLFKYIIKNRNNLPVCNRDCKISTSEKMFENIGARYGRL